MLSFHSFIVREVKFFFRIMQSPLSCVLRTNIGTYVHIHRYIRTYTYVRKYLFREHPLGYDCKNSIR